MTDLEIIKIYTRLSSECGDIEDQISDLEDDRDTLCDEMDGLEDEWDETHNCCGLSKQKINCSHDKN